MAAASSTKNGSKHGSNAVNAVTAGYTVNSSSMLSLLSEVSRHTDSHKRGSSSAASASKGGSVQDGTGSTRKKQPKKGSLFDRANRGIEARSARDRSHMLAREDLSVEARRVLESREKMEKKAALYEKLAKGEGLRGTTREQLREGLLVDFETKAIEEAYNDRSSEGSDSDSDSDGDEHSTENSKKKAKLLDDDDELVESTDDLGRTRWVRKSQLAREAAEAPRGSVIDDGALPFYSNDISLASHSLPSQNSSNTYYGDQREFHVYEPSPEEIAERRKKLNLDAPLNAHFDGSKEVRNRGAGFMQLSGDEEVRKKQMEELMNERKETEQQREKLEAQGDAQARRNKELEERKRLIEEKKRQVLEKRKAADAAREEQAKKAKAG